ERAGPRRHLPDGPAAPRRAGREGRARPGPREGGTDSPQDLHGMARPREGARVSRILVVEDDSAVRRSVAMCLRDQGHEVVEVLDGAEAIDRLSSEIFDLV